jgi:hypothetical protein
MPSLSPGYLSSLSFGRQALSAIRGLGEARGRQQLFIRQYPEQLERLRSVSNIDAIRHSVEQARAKFTGAEPSLLVLADDFFLPLRVQTWACDVALFSPRQPGWSAGYLASDGPFATSLFSNVGGVMVFWFDRDSARQFCTTAFGRRLHSNLNASIRVTAA